MPLPRPSLATVLIVPTLVLIALFVVVQCDVSHALRATTDQTSQEP
jgi:hypothetical protein